jgi:hypothetical protein
MDLRSHQVNHLERNGYWKGVDKLCKSMDRLIDPCDLIHNESRLLQPKCYLVERNNTSISMRNI